MLAVMNSLRIKRNKTYRLKPKKRNENLKKNLGRSPALAYNVVLKPQIVSRILRMLCPELSLPLLLSVCDCACVSILWARYIKNAYIRIQTWTKKQKAVLKAPFEVWLTTRKALARNLSWTCSNPNYPKTYKKWQQDNRFVMHISLLVSFSFSLSTSLRYGSFSLSSWLYLSDSLSFFTFRRRIRSCQHSFSKFMSLSSLHLFLPERVRGHIDMRTYSSLHSGEHEYDILSMSLRNESMRFVILVWDFRVRRHEFLDIHFGVTMSTRAYCWVVSLLSLWVWVWETRQLRRSAEHWCDILLI
jgi:hypothetical protein